jgi:transcriptional regulator with XRE-family HTH domain
MENDDAIPQIHQGKTPNRRHFIPEWAEVRHLSRQDIINELDVDKGQVSRWFNGQLPQPRMQARLEALLDLPRNGIFRHPDVDWLSRLFEGRDKEERDRMKQSIELAWQRKRG